MKMLRKKDLRTARAAEVYLQACGVWRVACGVWCVVCVCRGNPCSHARSYATFLLVSA